MNGGVRWVFGLALLCGLAGCTTFRYDYAKAPVARAGSPGAWRVAVEPLRDRTTAMMYFPPYGALLAEPYGDLSRGLAAALERSGAFARVVYAGEAGTEAAECDAVLTGEVSFFRVTAIMEPWSMVPPVTVLWPLHLLGLPVGPSRNGMIVECQLRVDARRPGGPSWQTPPLRATYWETVYYSSLNVWRKDEEFIRHAMDSVVDQLALVVVADMPE